ncbi:MAG: carph-isopro domain-containing protein [Aquabacterium sp.]
MNATEVIDRLGGATNAARKLRLGRQAVQMWKTRGVIPSRHVPQVAQALGVPAETVWPALSATPQPQQEAA